MRALLLTALLALTLPVCGQDKSQSRQMIGKVGARSALLVLHATARADGSWQVAGEYVLLPTLVRRFIEGERSPELAVTVLKEGATPILFGRPGIGELRGTWRDSTFKGTRYGPGGQRREDFEFSEDFPSMEAYSANVRCEAKEGRYQSKLNLSVREGRLMSFDWRSVEPGGQGCTVQSPTQVALRGGLQFVSGACRITLRDLGELAWLSAENCVALCGAEGYLEPLLFDRRGNCELLRHGAR